MKVGFVERRASPRYVVAKPSILQDELGERQYDCLIANLSDDGAGLVAQDIAVPIKFLLSANSVWAARKHRCTIVWRDGYRFGVKFAPSPKAVRS